MIEPDYAHLRGTAFGIFYRQIDEGKRLPVAIRIEDLHGHQGIAAQGIRLTGNSQAERLAFSKDWRDRAKAAIHAVNFAQKKTEENYENIRAIR